MTDHLSTFYSVCFWFPVKFTDQYFTYGLIDTAEAFQWALLWHAKWRVTVYNNFATWPLELAFKPSWRDKSPPDKHLPTQSFQFSPTLHLIEASSFPISSPLSPTSPSSSSWTHLLLLPSPLSIPISRKVRPHVNSEQHLDWPLFFLLWQRGWKMSVGMSC